ncbi:MAG TPA: hypothetical protein VIQ99_05570 [Gammaproteobacteria bacterium]
MTDLFATRHDVAEFIQLFEGGQLPRARWTHRGHLVAGFWYLSLHPFDEALGIVRARIRRHNEAVGTPNTDSNGYHETITRLYLIGIDAHRAAHDHLSFERSLAALLTSPLADSGWPLAFYSRERLFSVEARRGWIAPDLRSLPAAASPARRGAD